MWQYFLIQSKKTTYARSLQKLKTLNLCHFIGSENPRNHFSTV